MSHDESIFLSGVSWAIIALGVGLVVAIEQRRRDEEDLK